MPRYYFDIDDGVREMRDGDGHDCADDSAMRNLAVGILPDIARDEFSGSDRRDLTVRVRDETGHIVFVANLSLVSGWLDGNGS